MSSFLSNFDPNQYDSDQKNKERQEEPVVQVEGEPQEERTAVAMDKKTETLDQVTPTRRHQTEETEFDPKFKKRQKQKRQLVSILGAVVMVVGGLIYYQMSHISMPDFNHKPIADVQQWAAKNKMTLENKTEFTLETEKNHVLKQPKTAGKQVKKGSSLVFVVSKGADPKEKVTLPDFAKMSQQEAESWLKKVRVTNFVLVSEYDEKIAVNKFIRQEFAGEATKENFKREDNGKLVYSKGKEVYQKDIAVPDFKAKNQSDVEAWAKKNELDLEIKKVASEAIKNGEVVKQSIKAKDKIAKKTKFVVEISAGKGTVVPNFANLTKEKAMAQGKLQVNVEEQFNEEVPYGQLLSQSVEAGTELTDEDDLLVNVVYSAGKPYLEDLTGKLEGELQKIFFEEFRSKGANIYYVVNYVNSEEKKGTIVSMDTFNTFLPLEYTVTVNVSNGP